MKYLKKFEKKFEPLKYNEGDYVVLDIEKFTKNNKIDNNNKLEESIHDEIAQLVETMLQLNKEKPQTTTPDKLNQLNTRIQYTDDKINKLVYQLYGLSEEEVGIVAGKA